MKRQAEATKRKHQVSSDAPPAKRRSEISSVLAKKASDKETQRTFKGSTHKTFPPKKYLDSIGNGRQEEKPCIKTSSLFKNNPEIPELHSTVVKQAREQVFSPEAFQELDLHPHLISTINTVLKMSSMTRELLLLLGCPQASFCFSVWKSYLCYMLLIQCYTAGRRCSEAEYPSAAGRQRCPSAVPDGLR